MRTIGLIGGMSWESSAEYYRIVNEETARRRGGLHSSSCVLVSVDFQEVEELQRSGRWEAAGELIGRAARQCEAAGAEILVLCTNTMHRVLEIASRGRSVPFLHIADATAARIHAAGIATVGLLGTRYTMEGDFYRGRLEHEHGLTVLIPDTPDRAEVHRVIYDELVLGRIEHASRERYLAIIDRLVAAGAQGIVAGCTEIGLLIEDGMAAVPIFDTARIHAEEAVRLALEE